MDSSTRLVIMIQNIYTLWGYNIYALWGLTCMLYRVSSSSDADQEQRLHLPLSTCIPFVYFHFKTEEDQPMLTVFRVGEAYIFLITQDMGLD